MKRFLLSFIFVAGCLWTISAQTNDSIATQPTDTLITFEMVSDTTGWEVFANGATPGEDDVSVVENPDSSEVNPSAMVLRFVVNEDADPWAGLVLRDVFVGDSAIAVTEENYIFTMQVHRDTIGRVGLKLEDETGGGEVAEIVVETTLANEWEVVTFDFSEFIGSTFETIVIFPDFPEEARTAGAEVYLDNIMFGSGTPTSSPLKPQSALRVYPNPAQDRLYVQHPQMTGYSISNSLGQTIERQRFGLTNQRTINVAKLRSGVHFITIEANDGIHTTRFIKN